MNNYNNNIDHYNTSPSPQIKNKILKYHRHMKEYTLCPCRKLYGPMWLFNYANI